MAMVIMNDIAQTRNELIKIFTVTVIAMTIPFMQMSKLIDLRMHHLPDDATAEEMLTYAGSFYICSVFLMVVLVGATFIFRSFRTRATRIAFLMLPASNAEKYMARMGYVTLGIMLTAAMAIVVADIAQYLINLIVYPGFKQSFIVMAASSDFQPSITINADHYTLKSESWTLWLGLVWAHSCCLLGGAIFRKHAQPIMCIFFVVLLGIVAYMMGTTDLSYYISLRCINTVFPTLFVSLAIFNHIMAYRIFCRLQVDCNRMTNL